MAFQTQITQWADELAEWNSVVDRRSSAVEEGKKGKKDAPIHLLRKRRRKGNEHEQVNVTPF